MQDYLYKVDREGGLRKANYSTWYLVCNLYVHTMVCRARLCSPRVLAGRYAAKTSGRMLPPKQCLMAITSHGGTVALDGGGGLRGPRYGEIRV